jgi:hypothetical protein
LADEKGDIRWTTLTPDEAERINARRALKQASVSLAGDPATSCGWRLIGKTDT